VRLLILISSLSNGGAERTAALLANHWSALGWQVTIVTLAPQSKDFYPLDDKVRRIALNMDGESSSRWRGLVQNIKRVRAVRRCLKSTRPHAALAMMSTANVLLALASVGLKNTVTVGAERVYPPHMPLGRPWELLRRHTYGLLNVVVAQTRLGAKWIERHTNAKRATVIPNSVVWPLTNHAPTIAVESVHATDRKLLLTVGRLSEQKQPKALIDAFQSLAGLRADWDLVILGEGPLRPGLEKQVAAADLNGRVFLPGRVGNMADWYARADLFVLNSRFEGFPNALVEAMAAGLPVVSTDCETGPRELIQHGVNGMLVAVDDTHAMTHMLALLMADPILRNKMAVRAAEVRENLAHGPIARKWEQTLGLVDSATPPSSGVNTPDVTIAGGVSSLNG